VYLLNKSDYHTKLDVIKMKSCINNLLKDSKLMFKGSVSDLSGVSTSNSILNSGKLKKRPNHQVSDNDSDSVNFVLLPKLDQSSTSSNKKENIEGGFLKLKFNILKLDFMNCHQFLTVLFMLLQNNQMRQSLASLRGCLVWIVA
jgi:hypothetical protein